MPHVNRIAIAAQELQVGASAVILDSETTFSGDGQYATQVNGFLDIECIDDPDVRVDVYRWGGARSDAMEPIDSLPVVTATTAGVFLVPWDEPVPAWFATRLIIQRIPAAGTFQVNLRLLQAARWD